MQPFPSTTVDSMVKLFCCMLLPSLLLCALVAEMKIKGGTSQACAACKYQRRRCSSDCVLAPFFPGHQPKMFQNAHRLFGVRNITKILQQLDHDQKEEAMRSIIYESNIRESFPVHGCKGIICQLQQQLQQSMEELHYVRMWLVICKGKIKEEILPSMPLQQHCPSSQLQLGILPTNNTLPISPQYHSQYQSSIGSTNYLAPNHFFMSASNGVDDENIDQAGPLWAQHPQYFNLINNNNSVGLQSPLIALQSVPIQQETEVSPDYDDIPLDTIADDRQCYIKFKEACESSAESSLRDTTQSIEHVSKNELKNAAAYFTLTSVT